MIYRVGQLVRIISAPAYPWIIGAEAVILRVHEEIPDAYLTSAISDRWARSHNLVPIIFDTNEEKEAPVELEL
jgi:hypothetical protein